MLGMLGAFLPFLGVPIGAWYLYSGPTTKRWNARLDSRLATFTPEDFASGIESQITTMHLWDDEWIKTNWTSLTADRRLGLIRDLFPALHPQLGQFLHSFDMRRGAISADFVSVFHAAMSLEQHA
jgi:hypothetical protein